MILNRRMLAVSGRRLAGSHQPNRMEPTMSETISALHDAQTTNTPTAQLRDPSSAANVSKGAGMSFWEKLRATTIIYPDGRREIVVVTTLADRLKLFVLGLHLTVLVGGILFAQSLAQWFGERMAGYLVPVMRGVILETWRQTRPW